MQHQHNTRPAQQTAHVRESMPHRRDDSIRQNAGYECEARQKAAGISVARARAARRSSRRTFACHQGDHLSAHTQVTQSVRHNAQSRTEAPLEKWTRQSRRPASSPGCINLTVPYHPMTRPRPRGSPHRRNDCQSLCKSGLRRHGVSSAAGYAGGRQRGLTHRACCQNFDSAKNRLKLPIPACIGQFIGAILFQTNKRIAKAETDTGEDEAATADSPVMSTGGLQHDSTVLGWVIEGGEPRPS